VQIIKKKTASLCHSPLKPAAWGLAFDLSVQLSFAEWLCCKPELQKCTSSSFLSKSTTINFTGVDKFYQILAKLASR
jgi:hypothetical protein